MLPMEDLMVRPHEPRFGALWLNKWMERIQARVPPLAGMLIAIVLAALAFYSRYVLFIDLENRFPYLLGIPVVVVTAGLFGAPAAMAAAVVGVLLPAYHLMEPVGSFLIDDPVNLFGAGLYLMVSMLVAITVSALASAKTLAVEYGLERRQMHQEMRNLLHELRHRTKNELQQLYALTIMTANAAASPEESQSLKALGRRIQAVSQVHDILADVMKTPDDPVDSRSFLEELTGKITAAIGRDGVEIRVRAEGHPLKHTAVVPLGIVVNELTMNAIKHAFPGGEGTITIAFERDGTDFVLMVCDNGVGTVEPEADAPRRRGIGKRVIAGLARNLGGDLKVYSGAGSGTRCELRFPLKGKVV